MFWIVTCFMYPRVFTKEGSCGDCCLSCDSSLYFGEESALVVSHAIVYCTNAWRGMSAITEFLVLVQVSSF